VSGQGIGKGHGIGRGNGHGHGDICGLSVQVRTAETAETAEIAEIAETANQQTEELGHGYEFRGRGVESREARTKALGRAAEDYCK